ncbi:MAG: hypothetical protein HFI92_06535 [Lachnospiraceae bacterium]|nr:hypothetical protein [Lachnospiraceae bacterium]
MLEITIHVTGLEKLAEALMGLSGMNHQAAAPVPGAGMSASAIPPQGVPVASGVAPAVPGMPTSAPVATQPMPGPVPTSTVPQEYTQDQIAVAMTGLSDQGRGAELVNILARFGVSSLVQVPKERYPELVLILREAGAAI